MGKTKGGLSLWSNDAERGEILVFVLNAAHAAIKQSRAEAAWEKWLLGRREPGNEARLRTRVMRSQIETRAAGSALLDAHRAMMKRKRLAAKAVS